MATTTALFGRTTELSRLRAFCADAEQTVTALLLQGERGVGKTALLDAVAAWAAGESFRVLRAHPVPSEATTDFSTLGQLLLPVERAMAGLEVDDRQALSDALGHQEGSGRDARVVARAALALLRLVAADRPLLLVVDDVEWVDARSAQVLGRLVQRVEDSPIGLLGAYGPHGTGFLDAGTMPCVLVRPLDPAAATELVTRHFPALGERELSEVLRLGRGNPLALLELPRVLRGDGRDQPLGQAGTVPFSRRVLQAFTADLQTLPAETIRLLLLLALDATGDLSLWADPTGPAALESAERAGLVSTDAEARRVTFNHPLIPFVVVGLATSEDRRTAHQELSRLLSGRPGRRAPHLAQATTWPDEAVAAELEAAAPLLARDGDAAATVALYRRSAALSENLAHQARRLARGAQLSALVTGDLSLAGDLLQQARRSDPDVVSSLPYAVALSTVALRARGDADTAHDALVHALGVRRADRDAGYEPRPEAVQALRELCRWTRRPEHYSSLSGVPTEVDHPGSTGGPEGALGAGSLPLHRVQLEALVAAARPRGGTALAVEALCCLAEDAFSTGDWDRACLLAEEGLAWCDRQGDQLRSWTLRWVETLVAAGRGDLSTVNRNTEEMLQWAERHAIARVGDFAHHARALAALGSGDVERAYQNAEASAPVDDRSLHGPGTLERSLILVEAAAHSHRGDAASRAAEAVRARTQGTPSPQMRFLVAASLAMAADVPDRAQLFERALADPGAEYYPFVLARLHLGYGQQLRRSRATSLARTHLRAALGLFEHLGASPWVERTRIEVDATGETRNQVEPRFVLTPQERTIALLAASGHTNKQIAVRLLLTHRTVAAHLHQVFRKLGVDSRAALRDALESPSRHPLSDERLRSTTSIRPQHGDGALRETHRALVRT